MNLIQKMLKIIGIVVAMTGMANAALIHKYTFDSGTAFDSVGGANGTLYNGASIVNGELSLDGVNDYMQTVGNQILPTAGDFTVIFFAKQASFGGSYVEMISQGSSGSGFYIGYDPSHYFRITDDNTSTSLPFPTDGQYHNYALTHGAGGNDFYIDGVFQQHFATIANGTGDTRLGRQFDPDSEYFNGVIDNVQIYNTVLSSGEISAIAAAGPNPPPEPVPAVNNLGLAILITLTGLGTLMRFRQRHAPN